MILERTTPYDWKKMGLICTASESYTHASHPCAIHYHDDIFIIAYTQRDSQQRSQIFLSYARVADGRVTLIGVPKLALTHGEKGHFDCDGSISGCFIKHKNDFYLYYVGWLNLPDGLWTCNTGRAILDPEKLTLRREFSGPVLGMDKTNPLFAAATAVYESNGLWQTWYNSGIQWERKNSAWNHYYGFFYAESTNGVDWKCDTKLCIPFADKYEYAFGRPSVIVQSDKYYMWFAHRGTKDIATYRIGFAKSCDGKLWIRNDDLAGIDVSSEGWDSEMICYPCVFEHNGLVYMLYNGNGYGKTGFGLAILSE